MFLFWLLRCADTLRHRARLRHWNSGHAAGRRAEDLAHRFLQRHGFTIVARNYRTRSGTAEVDLIAREGEALVFVEVKSRANEDFGPPDRAVDAGKRQHLVRAAREYTRRSGVPLEQVRFDLVNVVFTDPPSIEHLRDAFGRNAAV